VVLYNPIPEYRYLYDTYHAPEFLMWFLKYFTLGVNGMFSIFPKWMYKEELDLLNKNAVPVEIRLILFRYSDPEATF
jgi:hypothetical protein